MIDPPLPNKSGMTAKAIISSVIFAIISLQAYAGIVKLACTGVEIPFLCGIPKDPILYPFLNYPMYRSAKPEGVSVPKYALIATYQDGTEKQLQAKDFGLSTYWFNRGVIYGFEREKDAEIAQYIEAYEKTGNQPFVSLRLDVTPLIIEKEGVVEGEPFTVNNVVTNAGEEK